MFTLPVTAGALAGWPMLFGTVAMVILWVAARLLVAWPSGFDVPTIWPALLAASLLSWTQALTWMPYGLPGLRVIVTVLWLAAIDAIVLVALDYQAREPLMLAILAPHVPLAYLAARFASRTGGGRWRRSRRRPRSCRTGEAVFLRPPPRSPGSSGEDTAGRCRRWSGSCCRSSWDCSS
jgi:hypothetical protein